MRSDRILALTTLAAALAATTFADAQQANGLDRRAARIAQAASGQPLAVLASPTRGARKRRRGVPAFARALRRGARVVTH